jgi:hypothetical protein
VKFEKTLMGIMSFVLVCVFRLEGCGNFTAVLGDVGGWSSLPMDVLLLPAYTYNCFMRIAAFMCSREVFLALTSSA